MPTCPAEDRTYASQRGTRHTRKNDDESFDQSLSFFLFCLFQPPNKFPRFTSWLMFSEVSPVQFQSSLLWIWVWGLSTTIHTVTCRVPVWGQSSAGLDMSLGLRWPHRCPCGSKGPAPYTASDSSHYTAITDNTAPECHKQGEVNIWQYS